MLVRLLARRFRNLEPLELELAPGAHLILGANGAGKTSLLEAVYVLATTRSFRTPRLVDCVRHGADGCVLRGETERRAILELTLHEGHRMRSLGGDRVGSSEYLAALPVIAWTAADAALPTGPPAERRRFLDRGIVAERPAALDVLGRYRRALEGKRRLLAGGRVGSAELASWNQVLATIAAEYAARRGAYVERLRRAFAEVLEVCALDLPAIELEYRPSPRAALDGPEALLAALEAAAPRELAAQVPLLGPQRDDLSIRWSGLAVKRVASAGERKALGLALLAAHGRILEAAGRAPVYLLDDLDTELDRDRLAALWRHFGAAGQILATSNRPHAWDDLALARRWHCRRGRLLADPPE